ncbi:metal ABC transporter substrate-binding protein [Streptomyces sp. NPDC006879]|uniref:metal ABC transporter substrate-binding protein n=1 Tax=Streptomyces sp. NPDC006879 TaxID=3364767 RepID=UPI0036942CAE
MNVRGLIPTAALAGAVALAATTLSACSDSAATDRAEGKVDVVASFYPMEFLAREIGKDHVSVTGLTKPGVEPHDLEITPKQTARLSEADLVLYLKGLQPAVDEAVAQSGAHTAVDAAQLTTLEAHGDGGHDHESGEHDGHDHGNTGKDPHIWLDPTKYREVARGVESALTKADPQHADAYRKNADALVGRLTSLDKDFQEGLKDAGTRTFITTHAAFGYLAERYGLDQESISGIDPESEPSPARMKELQSLAREEKVTTVFFETLASDKTAKSLAADTGLRTDVLDPLEGITDASQGADYFEVMRSNLKNLQKALGAK